MGKILFIRGGAVGDFILTLPAIQLVRSTLPEVKIEILGYESIAELAITCGLADKTRSIEHAAMAPFFAPGAKLDEETCRYFSSFDVVISYLYDPDDYFAENLEKAGVDTLIRGPFRMEEKEPWISTARQLAAPLEHLALYLETPFVEVSYGPFEKDPANGPVIALHPGSGSPAKNWGFENWIDLLVRISDKLPETRWLIISGEAEHGTIAAFLGLLKAAQIKYEHLDQLSLSDLGNRIQMVDLFLGHDSGISHLAASTGVEGLVLFGQTNPEIWAPQHPSFHYIEAPGDQLGNLTPKMVWQNPTFRKKMEALSDFPHP